MRSIAIHRFGSRRGASRSRRRVPPSAVSISRRARSAARSRGSRSGATRARIEIATGSWATAVDHALAPDRSLAARRAQHRRPRPHVGLLDRPHERQPRPVERLDDPLVGLREPLGVCPASGLRRRPRAVVWRECPSPRLSPSLETGSPRARTASTSPSRGPTARSSRAAATSTGRPRCARARSRTRSSR